MTPRPNEDGERLADITGSILKNTKASSKESYEFSRGWIGVPKNLNNTAKANFIKR
ncbi:MAG: hypothetical protein ACRCXT_15525 [Paraclostridium sp.]